MFIPGRFATLLELTHYFRSLARFVTPDPNIMLRAARLRDVKWQRPQEPMSLGDAIQIASALCVKEALRVRDLQFLLIDERRTDQARGGLSHSTVRLQDYADNTHTASMRSLRKAARNVAVFHLPCGTLSTRRSPFGAQPRSLVMLVFVQSLPPRRRGLIDDEDQDAGDQCAPGRRASACDGGLRPGGSCPRATRVFF